MSGKNYYGSDLAAERRHTIEQCAKIADECAGEAPAGEGEIYIARQIADRIRALLAKPEMDKQERLANAQNL